jgi:hypothetical protein
MKLRRVQIGSDAVVQVRSERGWIALADILAALPARLHAPEAARWSRDIVAFLAAPSDVRAAVQDALAHCEDERDGDASVLVPFEPRSYRDFALFEGHMVGAARGFVRKFWPHLLPVIGVYETVTGRTFPALRPKRLWYREPIYYLGNHLAFVTDGDIRIPPYTRAWIMSWRSASCLPASFLTRARPKPLSVASSCSTISAHVTCNMRRCSQVSGRRGRRTFATQSQAWLSRPMKFSPIGERLRAMSSSMARLFPSRPRMAHAGHWARSWHFCPARSASIPVSSLARARCREEAASKQGGCSLRATSSRSASSGLVV